MTRSLNLYAPRLVNRQALLSKYPQIDWRDRQFILANILNISREELIANSNKTVTMWHQFKYWWAIKKRKNNTPLAYILGKQPFYGLEFFVNKHTLIPRPETEQLVNMALEIIREKNIQTVIDVGTGSGAIAITIAKHAPQVKVIATDISKTALKIAKKNTLTNNVDVEFLSGNLLDPVIKTYNLHPKTNNLIIANLPYLPTKTYEATEKQVKKEPKLALEAGEDGLNLYRELIDQIKQANINCDLIFECDPENANELAILIEQNFTQGNIRAKKDFQGLDRFIVYKKEEARS